METVFIIYTILCSLSFFIIGIIRIIKATNKVQVSDGLFEIFLGVIFPGGLIMSFFFIMIGVFQIGDLITKIFYKIKGINEHEG